MEPGDRIVRTSVTVNGETFYLSDRRDVPALQADVVTAARTGGELVDVSNGGDRTRCVLVTPALSVTFRLDDADDASTVSDAAADQTWVYEDF